MVPHKRRYNSSKCHRQKNSMAWHRAVSPRRSLACYYVNYTTKKLFTFYYSMGVEQKVALPIIPFLSLSGIGINLDIHVQEIRGFSQQLNSKHSVDVFGLHCTFHCWQKSKKTWLEWNYVTKNRRRLLGVSPKRWRQIRFRLRAQKNLPYQAWLMQIKIHAPRNDRSRISRSEMTPFRDNAFKSLNQYLKEYLMRPGMGTFAKVNMN